MFGFLKKKRKSLIGMDIGSNVIKCIRLDLKGETPVLTHFAMTELAPEAIVDGEIMDRELVIQAIQECAEKAGVPNEPMATAVAGRAIIVRKIVMDKMSQEDAREAIYWEAEQHVPFDIDDITLDFEILNEDIGADQMEMLLVAAKKDMILTQAELIRDAGFMLHVVDVASFANQNCWELLLSDTLQAKPAEVHEEPPMKSEFDEELEQYDAAEDEVDDHSDAASSSGFVALLDIGGGVTNVHIVRDGIPFFTRDLPLGIAQFIEEFQKQLGLTYESAQWVARGHTEDVDEQLVVDIVRSVGSEIYQGLEPSLSYLKTSGEADGIDQIVLCGGGAHLPGLVEYLAESYNVPGDIADPLAAIDYAPDLFEEGTEQEISPLLTVCLGLALRQGGES